MTYEQIRARLRACGIPDAAEEARLLFCHYTGCRREELFASPHADCDAEALIDAVNRRCAHEPLQYILTEWHFCDLPFSVSPDCLIPRYDTEILVQTAMSRLPSDAYFADLCTGSGCIAVTLLHRFPGARALATDISDATCAIAQKNAQRNGVSDQIRFLRADFFDGVLPVPDASLDAILANPPYIPSDVIPTLAPEVQKEPHRALDGGTDGLDFYRAFLPLYAKYLKPDGFAALEIGYDQGDALRQISRSAGFSCEIVRDLDGHDRVALLRP